MKYILTNYGHRFILKLQKAGYPQENIKNQELQVLFSILKNTFLNEINKNILISLTQKSLIQPIYKDYTKAQIELRYKRNPLEHIQSVVFELTTECNFSCSHCRNGFIKTQTETNIEALKYAVDVFVRIGIVNFSPMGISVVSFATDLQKSEIAKLRKGKRVSEDDVLDIHQMLEDKTINFVEMIK